MALPDYVKMGLGASPIVWKNSGGNYAITCTSLANGSARQGAKGDLGALFARRWRVEFECKLTSAGTNQNEVEIYVSGSTNATAGTGNAGNASGTDAAYSTPAEYKLQLTPIGSLSVSNNAGTGVQRQAFVFTPDSRYISPVIVNGAGVDFSSTAGDTILTFTPLEESVEDTV